MATFPPSLTVINVSAQIPIVRSDGFPEVGSVTFIAPEGLTIDGICIPSRYTVPLDENGLLQIVLPAGDDVDLSEFGWAYHIIEDLTESSREYDSEIWEAHSNPDLLMFYNSTQEFFTLRRANEVNAGGTGSGDIGDVTNFAINDSQDARLDAVECSAIGGAACCEELQECCDANTACCEDHETRIVILEECCDANTACCEDHETRIDALEECCEANTACCEEQQAKVLQIELGTRQAPLLNIGNTVLVLTWPQAFPDTAYTITADVQASDANKARITLSLLSQTTTTATFNLAVTGLLPIALGSVNVHANGYRFA